MTTAEKAGIGIVALLLAWKAGLFARLGVGFAPMPLNGAYANPTSLPVNSTTFGQYGARGAAGAEVPQGAQIAQVVTQGVGGLLGAIKGFGGFSGGRSTSFGSNGNAGGGTYSTGRDQGDFDTQNSEDYNQDYYGASDPYNGSSSSSDNSELWD